MLSDLQAPRLLVRTLKRKSSLQGSREDFPGIEFVASSASTDLSTNPSVYEIDADEHAFLVRVSAEHSLSFTRPAPKTEQFGGLILLDDWSGGILMSEGMTKFQFTKQRHRELILDDAAAAESFYLGIFDRQEILSRDTSVQDVRQYVNGRRHEKDAEWLSFCNDSPKWVKWLDK
jgi:hypothetical protein